MFIPQPRHSAKSHYVDLRSPSCPLLMLMRGVDPSDPCFATSYCLLCWESILLEVSYLPFQLAPFVTSCHSHQWWALKFHRISSSLVIKLLHNFNVFHPKFNLKLTMGAYCQTFQNWKKYHHFHSSLQKKLIILDQKKIKIMPFPWSGENLCRFYHYT